MATQTYPYDSAEYLDTPEAQAAYLSEMMKNGDPALISTALMTIGRARNQVADLLEVGISADATELPAGMFIRAIEVLGLRLTVEAVETAELAAE